MKCLKKDPNYILIAFIYIAAVAAYSIAALQMNAPIFYPSDESLYIAIAKSLYFSGNVSGNYSILGYDCILYSVILAIGYLFYSPERIMFVFRFIGILTMCSSVFPVYMLARKLNIKKILGLNGALMIALMSVLIPEMSYTLFTVQEVLEYPLFMWMIFLVYTYYEKIDSDFNIGTITLTLVFYLMYMTKSYAIVFYAGFVLINIFYGVLKKSFKVIKKTVISILIYIVLFAVLRIILFLMNGTMDTESHYSSQIMSIFPVTAQFIINVMRGSLFYAYSFIFITGVIPCIYLVCNFRKYSMQECLWNAYLLVTLVLAVLEVVLIVFLPENGNEIHITRYHHRYLFYFFIPMLMITFRDIKIDMKIPAYCILIFTGIGILTYFADTNTLTGTLIDSVPTYVFRKLGVLTGFNETIVFMALFALIVLGIGINYGLYKYITSIYFVLVMCFVLITMRFNLSMPALESDQHSYPVYQDDYERIADYVNYNYEEILLLNPSLLISEEGYMVEYENMHLEDTPVTDVRYLASPVCRIPAFTVMDYIEVTVDRQTNELHIEKDNTILIIMSSYNYELEGNLAEIDIGTEYFNIYLAMEGKVNIIKPHIYQ